jgi:hypothetical protein
VTLLGFFLDGALRFHAAPYARVAYVHEAAFDRRTPFRLHRLLTAWTPNHRNFFYTRLHGAEHCSGHEKLSAHLIACETKLAGVA